MPRTKQTPEWGSRIFVWIVVALNSASWVVGTAAADDRAERPNIVLLYIDDLGWTDAGFQGSQFYETPQIDQLASQGMVFTSAYSNGPNCAPSRASLMTGLYTPRHKIFTVGDPARGNHRHRKLEPVPNETVLAEDFITIAERLREGGYATAAMGKWQLGKAPTTQGFDVNVAGREWGSPSGGGYHSPYKYPNLEQQDPGEYLTDRLTTEACTFVEAHRSEPFFLYLAHYAVHTPLQAKDDKVERYRNKAPSKRHRNAVYAAMIESVDESVGRVLQTLDRFALADNTIVIYYSDNGGYGGATSNAPLRGAKGMLYEGGIRVPLTVRWPGHVAAGSRCDEPVIGIDLYPTLLEVAGLSVEGQGPDGVSLVPLLEQTEDSLEREAIYWHFPCYLQGRGDPSGGPFRTTPAGAIRMGNWKLIEWFETGRLELYDLENDLGERTNLADREPERREQLHAKMKQWRAEVQAPIPTTPNPRYRPE
ncbi:Sulfatase (Arylsulfatase) (Polysaccharide utilization locus H protein P13) (PUL H protein P13) (Sulfatase family S1 subfamily 16 protein P13) (P13_S1_16) [Durusdinium trenchii]|uniref:Sulfatase (Arylsulfatase) (Polysaccharide utilization locus H protein P13) (PUL H protein P13) (Sulfatase family S1 subfamily 16 protein P13) (P13_S1_16) n=1 Tax=Durusdinium trenchii TaxID=1381693 RepID=A0ABP0LLL2_9DINO